MKIVTDTPKAAPILKIARSYRIIGIGFGIAAYLALIVDAWIRGEETALLWISASLLPLLVWVLVGIIRRREIRNSLAEWSLIGFALVVVSIGYYRIEDWVLAGAVIANIAILAVTIGKHFGPTEH